VVGKWRRARGKSIAKGRLEETKLGGWCKQTHNTNLTRQKKKKKGPPAKNKKTNLGAGKEGAMVKAGVDCEKQIEKGIRKPVLNRVGGPKKNSG